MYYYSYKSHSNQHETGKCITDAGNLCYFRSVNDVLQKETKQ